MEGGGDRGGPKENPHRNPVPGRYWLLEGLSRTHLSLSGHFERLNLDSGFAARQRVSSYYNVELGLASLRQLSAHARAHFGKSRGLTRNGRSNLGMEKGLRKPSLSPRGGKWVAMYLPFVGKRTREEHVGGSQTPCGSPRGGQPL